MFQLLIVDDEEMIVEGLQLLLPWQELDISIAGTATSAEEAIEIIKNQKIDILLTDISMDELTGLDLIKEINQLQPAAKTLVLSGFNEFDYIKEGLSLGIENYLLKPVNKDELLQTIQAITDKLRSDVILGTKKEVLKEHISKRLFFNQITKTEFSERAHLLGLAIPEKNCRTCLLYLQPDLKAQQPQLNYQLLEELFRKYSFPYWTQLETNCFVFLTDTLSIDPLKTKLNLFEKEINALKLELSFSIFVGLERPPFNHFQLSLESAEEMHEYYRLFTSSTSYFYEEFQQQQQMDLDYFETPLFKNLDTAIDARNKELISINIHKIFSDHRFSCKSSTYLKNCASIILLKLFQGFNKIYLDEFQAFAKNIDQVSDLEEIIALLLKSLDKLFSATNFSKFPMIIQELLAIITTDYQKPLSLKSVSKTLHVNTAYLGQLFQKEVEISFSEYLLNYRMQIAKQQLSQTTDSIESIAINVGFKEVSYFSRKFKQLFKQTANEYRGNR